RVTWQGGARSGCPLRFVHEFAVNSPPSCPQPSAAGMGCAYCVLESAMPAALRRCRWWIAASAAVLAAAVSAAPAKADTLTVSVDEARILQLPDQVTTIVIGNPLIADATLQRGGVLVITGKGYGATNLLARDTAGQVILDKTVRVQIGRASGRER